MARVRVLRVIEYEGELEWVLSTLAQNAVKGEYRIPATHGRKSVCIIRESIIGQPTAIDPDENWKEGYRVGQIDYENDMKEEVPVV